MQLIDGLIDVCVQHGTNNRQERERSCLVEADDGVDGDDDGQHDAGLVVPERGGDDGGCDCVCV